MIDRLSLGQIGLLYYIIGAASAVIVAVIGSGLANCINDKMARELVDSQYATMQA